MLLRALLDACVVVQMQWCVWRATEVRESAVAQASFGSRWITANAKVNGHKCGRQESDLYRHKLPS